jgi:hypothetical protein
MSFSFTFTREQLYILYMAMDISLDDLNLSFDEDDYTPERKMSERKVVQNLLRRFEKRFNSNDNPFEKD